MIPFNKKSVPKDPVKFLSGPKDDAAGEESCYDEVHALVQKYGQDEVQKSLDECAAKENADVSGEESPDNAVDSSASY